MDMSEQDRRAVAAKLFEDLSPLMENLHGRWQDEHDYEDINDYALPIRPMVEAVGGTLVRMTKRPFGFVYTLAGATYQVKVGRYYEYKRIA